MANRRNYATELYSEHNAGGKKFSNNPTRDRLGMLERMHIRAFTELCANRFKWTGLPDTINVRFLELTLFYQGLSVFYDDPKYGFLALQGGGTNWLNYQQDPVGFNVVGSMFAGKQLSAMRDTTNGGKAIPIWANYTRTPEMDVVFLYATKLADLDRTIEINAHNARQTKFVVATENQKLSISNINRQVDDGKETININGSIEDLAFMKSLDLGIETKDITELSVLRARLFNEAMGYLGIDNANQDKKERLVSSEVDANSEQTDMFRFSNLNSREIACELINKYYKLNLSVEYYTKAEQEEERQQALEDGIAASLAGSPADGGTPPQGHRADFGHKHDGKKHRKGDKPETPIEDKDKDKVNA